MKMILKKDIENLGRYGDQIKVAEGYARNYLLPKGLAMPATAANIKQIEAEKDAYVKKAAARKGHAEKLRNDIESITLSFQRKSGDDDRLFGSVTAHDIEEALKAKGLEVEKRGIHLVEPIKTIGQFTAQVKLHQDVAAALKIEVVKE